jgi:hypothetical protein
MLNYNKTHYLQFNMKNSWDYDLKLNYQGNYIKSSSHKKFSESSWLKLKKKKKKGFWFQWMLNLASHLYRLEKKWVAKLIFVVPPVLFSPRWIQYHYHELKLLFDIFLIKKILLNCKIFLILHRISFPLIAQHD